MKIFAFVVALPGIVRAVITPVPPITTSAFPTTSHSQFTTVGTSGKPIGGSIFTSIVTDTPTFSLSSTVLATSTFNGTSTSLSPTTSSQTTSVPTPSSTSPSSSTIRSKTNILWPAIMSLSLVAIIY